MIFHTVGTYASVWTVPKGLRTNQNHHIIHCIIILVKSFPGKAIHRCQSFVGGWNLIFRYYYSIGHPSSTVSPLSSTYTYVYLSQGTILLEIHDNMSSQPYALKITDKMTGANDSMYSHSPSPIPTTQSYHSVQHLHMFLHPMDSHSPDTI